MDITFLALNASILVTLCFAVVSSTWFQYGPRNGANIPAVVPYTSRITLYQRTPYAPIYKAEKAFIPVPPTSRYMNVAQSPLDRSTAPRITQWLTNIHRFGGPSASDAKRSRTRTFVPLPQVPKMSPVLTDPRSAYNYQLQLQNVAKKFEPVIGQNPSDAFDPSNAALKTVLTEGNPVAGKLIPESLSVQQASSRSHSRANPLEEEEESAMPRRSYVATGFSRKEGKLNDPRLTRLRQILQILRRRRAKEVNVPDEKKLVGTKLGFAGTRKNPPPFSTGLHSTKRLNAEGALMKKSLIRKAKGKRHWSVVSEFTPNFRLASMVLLKEKRGSRKKRKSPEAVVTFQETLRKEEQRNRESRANQTTARAKKSSISHPRVVTTFTRPHHVKHRGIYKRKKKGMVERKRNFINNGFYGDRFPWWSDQMIQGRRYSPYFLRRQQLRNAQMAMVERMNGMRSRGLYHLLGNVNPQFFSGTSFRHSPMAMPQRFEAMEWKSSNNNGYSPYIEQQTQPSFPQGQNYFAPPWMMGFSNNGKDSRPFGNPSQAEVSNLNAANLQNPYGVDSVPPKENENQPSRGPSQEYSRKVTTSLINTFSQESPQLIKVEGSQAVENLPQTVGENLNTFAQNPYAQRVNQVAGMPTGGSPDTQLTNGYPLRPGKVSFLPDPRKLSSHWPSRIPGYEMIGRSTLPERYDSDFDQSPETFDPNDATEQVLSHVAARRDALETEMPAFNPRYFDPRLRPAYQMNGVVAASDVPNMAGEAFDSKMSVLMFPFTPFAERNMQDFMRPPYTFLWKANIPELEKRSLRREKRRLQERRKRGSINRSTASKRKNAMVGITKNVEHLGKRVFPLEKNASNKKTLSHNHSIVSNDSKEKQRVRARPTAHSVGMRSHFFYPHPSSFVSLEFFKSPDTQQVKEQYSISEDISADLKERLSAAQVNMIDPINYLKGKGYAPRVDSRSHSSSIVIDSGSYNDPVAVQTGGHRFSTVVNKERYNAPAKVGSEHYSPHTGVDIENHSASVQVDNATSTASSGVDSGSLNPATWADKQGYNSFYGMDSGSYISDFSILPEQRFEPYFPDVVPEQFQQVQEMGLQQGPPQTLTEMVQQSDQFPVEEYLAMRRNKSANSNSQPEEEKTANGSRENEHEPDKAVVGVSAVISFTSDANPSDDANVSSTRSKGKKSMQNSSKGNEISKSRTQKKGRRSSSPSDEDGFLQGDQEEENTPDLQEQDMQSWAPNESSDLSEENGPSLPEESNPYAPEDSLQDDPREFPQNGPSDSVTDGLLDGLDENQASLLKQQMGMTSPKRLPVKNFNGIGTSKVKEGKRPLLSGYPQRISVSPSNNAAMPQTAVAQQNAFLRRKALLRQNAMLRKKAILKQRALLRQKALLRARAVQREKATFTTKGNIQANVIPGHNGRVLSLPSLSLNAIENLIDSAVDDDTKGLDNYDLAHGGLNLNSKRPMLDPTNTNGGELQASKPIDGGQLQASKPVDGGVMEASKPVDGGAMEASKPIDGGVMDASKPIDGGVMDASKPIDGGVMDTSKPAGVSRTGSSSALIANGKYANRLDWKSPLLSHSKSPDDFNWKLQGALSQWKLPSNQARDTANSGGTLSEDPPDRVFVPPKGASGNPDVVPGFTFDTQGQRSGPLFLANPPEDLENDSTAQTVLMVPPTS